MTTRRGSRTRPAAAVFVAVLALLGVPSARAAPWNLEWHPSSYDFGPVAYGTGPTGPHEFTLTNTTASRIVFQDWRYRYGESWPGAGDAFWSPADTSTPCVHALEPGESCSIELVFDPLHPGDWWSAVRVRGEGEELWTDLSVSGEGSGPWVPVTPGQLAFAPTTVGATSIPQTVTLENQDPKALTIEGISTTPVGSWPASSTPFKVVGGTCRLGGSIEPGQTCTFQVAMAPTAAGLLRSTLEVTDNSPDSPQSVELEGTAVAAPKEGQPPAPTIDVSGATSPPSPAALPTGTKRRCPRGRRSTLRQGHRLCVKQAKHHPRR
jgi:hypothetical protein